MTTQSSYWKIHHKPSGKYVSNIGRGTTLHINNVGKKFNNSEKDLKEMLDITRFRTTMGDFGIPFDKSEFELQKYYVSVRKVVSL